MTRPKFFIISSAVIFILERVLAVVSPWPVFIFPVFVILFILSNLENTPTDFIYVAITALFFDFFSGFSFGWLTLAILAVSITIYLFKTFFNIDGKSRVLPFVISLVFVFEYFFLLSIKTPRLIISQAPVILVGTAILLILMSFLFQKFLNPKS